MKQYHKHLEEILTKGTYKAPAREGMPGTTSLFGYQNRYDLSEGFPLLTTKKMNFNHIVTELLWFLKGDSNIKYLVDNGCNIWNEDAYNYFNKLCKEINILPFEYNTFIDKVKSGNLDSSINLKNYKLGDTGQQYPTLWRKWFSHYNFDNNAEVYRETIAKAFVVNSHVEIDQVSELIEGLKKNPMSRRHIITAWNPATLDDMALNACHAFVQFNCRQTTGKEKKDWFWENVYSSYPNTKEDWEKIPKYKLDCQMYQRSADMFLG